ncbi:hypothetical protein GPECTOR_2g1379 [Gonium pectorale]|uniref:Uncharacterized protein n=1 Tax=Gonium pectorale TaxID=33097 RepID=A0A150H1V6_GONPE|nr:hypothetical protein GPECTOR_2g1379 [Gonium pectorale]|eukprot:KXZ55828.1 hypothetical protein GPECTOR_2g1379 [Gonium pectorale]
MEAKKALGVAGRSVTTADNFMRSAGLCTLPDAAPFAGGAVPGASLFPTTSICNAGGGVEAYNISGPGGSVAGRAFLFIGYNGRLYITLTLNCNFLASTGADLAGNMVSVAVFSAANALNRPQYINVLYAPGLYSCYTLSVDLRSVCDPREGATFNPSPNAGSACLCAPGTSLPGCTGNPVNLFTPDTPLYVDVRVRLADYGNAGDTCTWGVLNNYTLSRPDGQQGPAQAPIFSVPPTVNVTSGPNCQLNDPPTTGAKVIIVLSTTTQALTFYNAYATPVRADTIVRVLSLPCNRSSVIFAAPGLAEPRVFDQRNVPALVCTTAPPPPAAAGRRRALQQTATDGADGSTPSPSPPLGLYDGVFERSVVMSVDTILPFPLTAEHCAALAALASLSVLPDVALESGPSCSLNDPPTTGAKVVLVLATQEQAMNFFGSYAISSRANTIARVLSLPCNRSSIIFAAPGLAEPSTFDQRNVPALLCAGGAAAAGLTAAEARRLIEGESAPGLPLLALAPLGGSGGAWGAAASYAATAEAEVAAADGGQVLPRRSVIEVADALAGRLQLSWQWGEEPGVEVVPDGEEGELMVRVATEYAWPGHQHHQHHQGRQHTVL